MATGGSVIAVSIDGREFAVPADVDVTISDGADENEWQMNGNRTGRLIKLIKPWMLENLQVSIDHEAGDLAFLRNIAGNNGAVPCTITLASNTTYKGQGQIVGPLTASSQSTTASFNLAGPGQLV